MSGYITFIAIIFLMFIGFCVYFIFKLLQFVIQAVDLYKTIVIRLDKIIELLAKNPGLVSTGSAQARAQSPKGVSDTPQQAGPVGLEEDDAAAMERYSIRFDGEKYHFEGFRYDKLRDAISYAKRQAARP